MGIANTEICTEALTKLALELIKKESEFIRLLMKWDEEKEEREMKRELKLKTPMLCIADLEKFKKANGGLKNVVTSLKLDGVRTLAQVNELTVHLTDPAVADVIYFSRSKKIFPNFGCFDEELSILTEYLIKQNPKLDVPEAVIFDGEVIDTSGDFSDLMGNVRRLKDVDNSNFQFNIFDIVIPNMPFIDRYKLLNRAFAAVFPDGMGERIALLKHGVTNFDSTEQMQQLGNQAVKDGYEGMVFKTLNGKYEQRRSPLWAKVKEYDTMDLPVINLIEGSGKLAGRVGKFECTMPNGALVYPGPGRASHDELRDMWEDYGNMPKMIEVGYNGLSKKGIPRHPRFIRVRDDKAA